MILPFLAKIFNLPKKSKFWKANNRKNPLNTVHFRILQTTLNSDMDSDSDMMCT